MKKPNNALQVLSVFAQYGPRKVSMNDIAEAAGLSRQSIYNQFGSKEAVLDWAVATVITDATHAGVACFADHHSAPQTVIAEAFHTWLGTNIHIWRGTPHGAELFEAAIASASQADVDYEGLFYTPLTEFLLASGLAEDPEDAADLCFALSAASKGLMLKASTSTEYNAYMSRVVRVICR